MTLGKSQGISCHAHWQSIRIIREAEEFLKLEIGTNFLKLPDSFMIHII